MKATCASRSSRRWVLATALLLGLTAFHHEGCTQERPGPMVGQQAPSFHVQGIFGETYSLDAFKGHILVMQFGASW